jgi:hypothetical protein
VDRGLVIAIIGSYWIDRKEFSMQASSEKMGITQVLLIIAVLITAVIHLGLGLDFLTNPGNIMFIFNGIGYIGLCALFLLPISMLKPYHEILRWVLMGYTALTIVLWVVINGKLEPVGIVTKLAEVAIIAILFIDRPKR